MFVKANKIIMSIIITIQWWCNLRWAKGKCLKEVICIVYPGDLAANVRGFQRIRFFHSNLSGAWQFGTRDLAYAHTTHTPIPAQW